MNNKRRSNSVIERVTKEEAIALLKEFVDSSSTSYLDEDDEIGFCIYCNRASYKHSDKCVLIKTEKFLEKCLQSKKKKQ